MAGNSLQLPVFISLLVSTSVIAFWVGVRRQTRANASLDRLAEGGDWRKIPDALEMEQSFMTRIVKPALRGWVRRLGQLMPHRNVERMQRNLERAGRPYDFTVSDFLGVRLLSGLLITASVASLLYLRDIGIPRTLLFSLVAGVVGSFLPSYWLRRQIKARQEEIRKGMPDALDMLSVAVSAGLGLDGAMQTISQKWDNAVADEFGKTIREIQIGVPRTDALRSMSRRANVKEMSHFIAVLVQADQLGLSIRTVLKTQSDQMRLMRRQRAEESANQAPVKMMFPLVLLIFPAIFAVLLGPAIPRLLTFFDAF